jgi:hypothetical protein
LNKVMGKISKISPFSFSIGRVLWILSIKSKYYFTGIGKYELTEWKRFSKK